MTLTSVSRRSRLLPALAVTPLIRWTIAVHSVPDDQPWRTGCSCGEPLWDSAVRPSGRCAGCGQRVGPPQLAVEAVAVVVAVALLISGYTGWTLAAYAWWATGMIVLAFVDLAVMRLPYRITTVTTVGFLALLAVRDDPPAFARAVVAGLALAGFFAAVAIAARGRLGWGDPVLAAPLGAALGWHSWIDVYAGTLLGLGVAAVTAIILRRTGRILRGHPIPFGPFLIAATVLMVMRP